MRECVLYTVEGVKEATAGEAFHDKWGRHVVQITTKDKRQSILVSVGTAERKFESEGPKPMFYCC